MNHPKKNRPFIVSVTNQKGGCSKTTHSTNIAGIMSAMGLRVLLLDTDATQASSTLWCAARFENEAINLSVKGVLRTSRIDNSKILRHELASLRNSPDYDVVIVDGAPQIQDLTLEMIKGSDLILIPVLPSAYDIAASSELIKLVAEQVKLREGTPQPTKAAIIVSQEIPNSLLSKGATQQVIEEMKAIGLEDEDMLPFMEARTTHLVAYKQSASFGQTVVDYDPSCKAANEMKALVKELQTTYGLPTV